MARIYILFEIVEKADDHVDKIIDQEEKRILWERFLNNSLIMGVKNGVIYVLIETDNLSEYSKNGVYLLITDNVNKKIYVYEEKINDNGWDNCIYECDYDMKNKK